MNFCVVPLGPGTDCEITLSPAGGCPSLENRSELEGPCVDENPSYIHVLRYLVSMKSSQFIQGAGLFVLLEDRSRAAYPAGILCGTISRIPYLIFVLVQNGDGDPLWSGPLRKEFFCCKHCWIPPSFFSSYLIRNFLC